MTPVLFEENNNNQNKSDPFWPGDPLCPGGPYTICVQNKKYCAVVIFHVCFQFSYFILIKKVFLIGI